jgi:hypothetical protein
MTINIKALGNVKASSAWKKGVKAYAIEMLESIENADVINSKEELKKAILNGAFNWKDYSYGGCTLVYNRDIAERLCTPSEFKKYMEGCTIRTDTKIGLMCRQERLNRLIT